MELLFIVLGGVILGALARYIFPLRDTHGSVLMPALGAVVAAVLWEALTWLGLRYDGGWIWVISLVLTGLVVGITDVVLGRRRQARDRAELSSLLSGKARVA
ncbi:MULTISPECIES: hypothetical protein [Subtercola]|uniref:GlsB/YeaQ/YmgE family stress response membrane protein n=1 Tax=Subtercola vilae TaxID=2056433 RepID=A0A4T2BZ78_9MICO|nr:MULTISPECIES: hypothetical protein [Subtercola]MEA9985898.1 hypothetical protein [Subtercola sp. RTI3]TIH36910.1 hypothetical protein D4765_09220 [Subtercola vilae]